MNFKVLLRKRGGVRARAAGAESGAGISNQPPRAGAPPLTSSRKPDPKTRVALIPSPGFLGCPPRSVD